MFATLIKKTYPVEDIILRVLKDLMKEDIKMWRSDVNGIVKIAAVEGVRCICI